MDLLRGTVCILSHHNAVHHADPGRFQSAGFPARTGLINGFELGSQTGQNVSESLVLQQLVPQHCCRQQQQDSYIAIKRTRTHVCTTDNAYTRSRNGGRISQPQQVSSVVNPFSSQCSSNQSFYNQIRQ